MNSMTYSVSDTFSKISSISISVDRSNSTEAFFKAAYHANSGAE